MPSLLQKTLEDLERRELTYCLLRHGDFPAAATDSDDRGIVATESASQPSTDKKFEDATQQHLEIDVLVAVKDLGAFERVLAERGFARLRRWGYAPHRFFVGYDEATDTWLKLDVVTRLAFGAPLHRFHTNLGADCLSRRRYRGDIPVPAAEDELIALLLHCIVDKGMFSQERGQQVQRLCREELNDERMAGLVAEYWSGPFDWPRIRQLITDGNWDGLLEQRSGLVRCLRRHEPVRSPLRGWRDGLLRKLSRIDRLLRPEIPTVALLAPDGAGKSTVANGVANTFFFPAEQIYMGLYQNDRSFKRWARLPGFGLFARLGRQWGRYIRASYHRAAGKLVMFDRYHYDALLPTNKPISMFGRLRRWMLAHSCPHADLVLLLDAAGKVLHARKAEFSADELEAQRQAYHALSRRLPQMVIVNAADDADLVRRRVTSCIWQKYSASSWRKPWHQTPQQA